MKIIRKAVWIFSLLIFLIPTVYAYTNTSGTLSFDSLLSSELKSAMQDSTRFSSRVVCDYLHYDEYGFSPEFKSELPFSNYFATDNFTTPLYARKFEYNSAGGQNRYGNATGSTIVKVYYGSDEYASNSKSFNVGDEFYCLAIAEGENTYYKIEEPDEDLDKVGIDENVIIGSYTGFGGNSLNHLINLNQDYTRDSNYEPDANLTYENIVNNFYRLPVSYDGLPYASEVILSKSIQLRDESKCWESEYKWSNGSYRGTNYNTRVTYRYCTYTVYKMKVAPNLHNGLEHTPFTDHISYRKVFNSYVDVGFSGGGGEDEWYEKRNIKALSIYRIGISVADPYFDISRPTGDILGTVKLVISGGFAGPHLRTESTPYIEYEFRSDYAELVGDFETQLLGFYAESLLKSVCRDDAIITSEPVRLGSNGSCEARKTNGMGNTIDWASASTTYGVALKTGGLTIDSLNRTIEENKVEFVQTLFQVLYDSEDALKTYIDNWPDKFNVVVDWDKFPADKLWQSLKDSNVDDAFWQAFKDNGMANFFWDSLVNNGFIDKIWQSIPEDMTDDAAPVIEVTRDPASVDTPRSSAVGVTLTITATDLVHTPGEAIPQILVNGASQTVTALNGGKSSRCTYLVRSNQSVSITSIDGNGNRYETSINVGNVDSSSPTFLSSRLANENWTKDPVRVTVSATDDVHLAPAPYRFYWLSHEDQNTLGITSPDYNANKSNLKLLKDWSTDPSAQVPKAGTVWCEIKDSVGNVTVSDPIYVRNIDQISPTVSATYSPLPGQLTSPDTGTTVVLHPNNILDPITHDASPLAAQEVRWAPNEGWTHELERTFHENTKLEISVRDSVGNEYTIPVTDPNAIAITNVAGDKPVITSITQKGDTGASLGDSRADSSTPYLMAPVDVTITVEKAAGASAAPLHSRCFSFDGGETWVTPTDRTLSGDDIVKATYTRHHLYNGDYSVMVRDALGTTVEEPYKVTAIDSVAPQVQLYLYRGLPDDWPSGLEYTAEDYVWRMMVDVQDATSGVDYVEVPFLGPTAIVSGSDLPFSCDVKEAGTFSVVAHDKAGNTTYCEKVVTNEAISENYGAGSNQYVQIDTPDGGTAASYLGASVGDLVYSKDGTYNFKTDAYTEYGSNYHGIEGYLNIHTRPSSYVTGSVSFNNKTYNLWIAQEDDLAGKTVGSPAWIACFKEKVNRGGNNTVGRILIPATDFTQDLRNARITVTVQEWNRDPTTDVTDPATGEPIRAKMYKDGTATLYTSVQVTMPKVNYTYNRATDELTLIPTSSIAGVASIQYKIDSGAYQDYTAPFKPGSCTTITVKCTDKTGNVTEFTLDRASLPVSGEGGGVLPTEVRDPSNANSPNSYYSSTRAAEIYIVGGTRSNTDNFPSSSVVGALTD